MPIIDSINGMFMELFPIGKIYRVFLFLYLLFLIFISKRIVFLKTVIIFGIFCVLQICVGIEYWQKSIQDAMKLFLPMLMIVIIRKLYVSGFLLSKDIHGIMTVWSIAYPVLIILPFMLGIGTSAYDGVTGNKGFFYAVNEVSFVICGLIMYQTKMICRKVTIKTITLLGSNILSIILMGTKTGYATVAIFFIAFVFNLLKNKSKTKVVFTIFCVVVGIGVAFLAFKSSIMEIIYRWQYQKEITSTSLIDFLTSQRLRRLESATEIFWNEKWWYKFVGWGLGGEVVGLPNMEMDWLDLLFRTGAIGVVSIFIFYYRYWKRECRKTLIDLAIVMWAFALSFGAGHVVFYGQSGMMLAMIMLFTSREKDNKVHSNEIKKEVKYE